MRFDGIGATFRDVEAGHVADVIRSSLGALQVQGKPRRRYAHVFDLEVAGRQAAWVGFDTGNGTVYAEGKGETSPDLVATIRAHFPDHTVSRLDACEDYDEPGAFERLQAVIRDAALRASRGAPPALGYVALPDDLAQGRTWGSMRRGGLAYLRLYESGKVPGHACYGRLHAVRAELEVRPHSPREKRAAASMSPLEVWGMAAWTHRVAEALCAVEIPRFEPDPSVYTQSRTQIYLARTFRRFWEEQLAEGRTWLEVGREIEEVWRLDDQVAASLNGGNSH